MISFLINLNTIQKPYNNGLFNTKKIVKREYSTSSLSNHPFPLSPQGGEGDGQINQPKNNPLGSYLAGLIEGDGNIYTPGLNVKGFPQIEIVFDIKDIELAKKIITVIGGGNLYIRPNGKSCRITFKKLDYLLKVVLLINGRMRTPKIEALHRLIN